ncbi:MAG: DUF418 domain-containing protein, partial [Kofleriaceae bacterium]
ANPAASRAELVAAMTGTDYGAVISMHLRQIVYHLSAIAAWYVPWVAGRFLLGYYVGRRQLFAADGANHLRLFRWAIGFGFGITAIAAAFGMGTHFAGYELTLPGQLVMVALMELSMLGLACAYAGAIVLAMQRPRWRRWWMVLAPVGQMPLTVYLSQSVACTFVFYGWGLGLAGQLGGAVTVAIALGIFVLQVIGATLWMRRFRFGPVEWVWRSLVYQRRQPMRRDAPVTGS